MYTTRFLYSHRVIPFEWLTEKGKPIIKDIIKLKIPRKDKIYVTKNNDFALVFKPLEREEEWTGDLDITITYNKTNTLSTKEKDSIINLMTLMTAAVDLMETDSSFLNLLFEHRDKINTENELIAMDLLEDEVSDKPNIITKEGNVIKINWTKQ